MEVPMLRSIAIALSLAFAAPSLALAQPPPEPAPPSSPPPLTAPSERAPTTHVPAAPGKPPGDQAVARCKDGRLATGPRYGAICARHGGVADWLR
jgi:hypothetical protein